jgi:hypothetical protein
MRANVGELCFRPWAPLNTADFWAFFVFSLVDTFIGLQAVCKFRSLCVLEFRDSGFSRMAGARQILFKNGLNMLKGVTSNRGDFGRRTPREAARLWISGIEALKRKVGVRAIYDLSATPFFLRGSDGATPRRYLPGFIVRVDDGAVHKLQVAEQT